MANGGVWARVLSYGIGFVLVAGASGCESSTSSDGSNSQPTVTVTETPDSDAGGAGRKEPLEFPEMVGDYVRNQRACDGNENCLASSDAVQLALDASAEDLSAAYGGASARIEQYFTSDLEFSAVVQVVRADSPGLWSLKGNDLWVERNRLGHAQEWVEEDGNAQCLLRTRIVIGANDSFSTEDFVVVTCRESGGGLTVSIDFGGEFGEAERGLAVTHDFYEAIAGS